MVSLFVHIVCAWILGMSMQVLPVKTPPKTEERHEMKTVPAPPVAAPARPAM